MPSNTAAVQPATQHCDLYTAHNNTSMKKTSHTQQCPLNDRLSTILLLQLCPLLILNKKLHCSEEHSVSVVFFVLYDISREKICWRLLANQPLLRNWPRKLPNLANQCKIMTIRPFRWFKITDFGTNRKPIYDFLLVLNTNLPPILQRFQVMADYISNFR